MLWRAICTEKAPLASDRSMVLRFSELRRAMPGISQKMLIQQLRDLEGDCVVFRKVYPEVPPKVEYSLTKDGIALLPSLRELQSWAAARNATVPIRKSSSKS
jgi:DNA-binding HxlR family transcriptional regulator